MAVFLHQWLLLTFFSFSGLTNIGSRPKYSHPFYIAVTEINQNAKEKSLEISVKVFADDLEKTLEQHYHQSYDLGNEKQKIQLDKLVADYVAKNLAVSVDGKIQRLSYVGFEKEKESAYCYFQIDNVSTVKRLDVTNSILHDYNNTQINIIHAVINGKRQSSKLDYPNKQVSFTW